MKLTMPGLLLGGAILALLGGSYFMVIKQANMKRQALLQDTRTKEEALANLERSTMGINDVNKKIADLQQAVTFFESKLPPAKETEKVLEEVWHIAEANSLTTKTIKTPAEKRTASYGEQEMELSLSGDFKGFYQFMLQLEKLPRLTRIKKMVLSKINDHEGAMQAELTLSVYFEPDPDTKDAPVASAAWSR
ncbi:MAG TPA: type 4a pilus biogenesis protein PilO [Tepidisphaeraceae bacterium]|nr:type 4a pilus biogenesis protein PilO [Tepidisphaeraceae bacterium]